MYLVSLFSSSFIEEEHQIWYFLEITQLYLIIFNRKKEIESEYLVSITLLLIISRFCRMINQTGNKWIHLKDIGDILKQFETKIPLLIVAGVSLLMIAYLEILKIKKKTLLKTFLFGINLILIYFYHITTNFEMFQL